MTDNITKQAELYAGKVKTIFETNDPDRVMVLFRDDTTAFDGEKVEALPRKGLLNNQINGFVMQKLEEAGVPTHFEGFASPNEAVMKRLDMIPVECVIRNVAAGGMSRRLGIEEGKPLPEPIMEFFLKDDPLHDPMINESHIHVFGWASDAEMETMKALTIKTNAILFPLFDAAGITLVDFKLEFGRFHGQVVLGDEFSPDGCRLWDKTTQKKLDKDRFRRDLGQVIEAYDEVAQRLGVELFEA